jgi:hypothetical protein
MCGNGENAFGIIAGLVAAAAMLVMAFAEKHGAHATAPAHSAVAQAVQAVSPISVDVQREGAHLDINLRF